MPALDEDVELHLRARMHSAVKRKARLVAPEQAAGGGGAHSSSSKDSSSSSSSSSHQHGHKPKHKHPHAHGSKHGGHGSSVHGAAAGHGQHTPAPLLGASDAEHGQGQQAGGSQQQVEEGPKPSGSTAPAGGRDEAPDGGPAGNSAPAAAAAAAPAAAAAAAAAVLRQASRLRCDVEVRLRARVPPPLSAVPGPLLSTAGGLLAKLVMQALLPSFLDLLAVDYARWASGDGARRGVAAGNLLPAKGGAAAAAPPREPQRASAGSE